MTSLDAASDYVRRGWRIVPVPADQKRPIIKGWPNCDFEPADFDDDSNVAIRLGQFSGGLVDCDLDCKEAIELAPLYLPETRAIFGRKAKPRSHWLYTASGAKFETFIDPIAQQTLLELRSDGRDGGAHLTLAPPSIADGEGREWCGESIGEPSAVDAGALRRRCAYLAIGCLVERYVSFAAAHRPGPDLPRILWEFDHELARPAYRWLGLPDPDAPQRYPRRRKGLSRRDLDLVEIVHAIPNCCDWHGWNSIGMAIFAASNGSEDGLIVFDDFSAKSAKYDPHAVKERWRNYHRSPPSRIGIGTLAHLAREAGWRPPLDR
jgi:hypothetical protein